MTTIDRPVSAVSGTIGRTLRAKLRLCGVVFDCGPRFRIFKGLRCVAHIVWLKHPGLSLMLRCHWHLVRTHSSWSRA